MTAMFNSLVAIALGLLKEVVRSAFFVQKLLACRNYGSAPQVIADQQSTCRPMALSK